MSLLILFPIRCAKIAQVCHISFNYPKDRLQVVVKPGYQSSRKLKTLGNDKVDFIDAVCLY